ncbi:hypothetical protein LRR18_16905, partial [Mangrovimonas sp. AS39]|uniref:hypothetical protein n=1 Tax=Mangrovimonas futianensis TaxID=2895523 RepID=UPI001E4EF3A6
LFTQYGLSQYIDTTGRKTLPSKELRCIGQTIWGNKEVRVYFLEEPQWDTPLKAEVAFLTPLKEYEVFKNIILRESHVVGSINLL